MPYIKKEARNDALRGAINAGELNYNVSQTIDFYISNNGVCYQTFNDVIGVLEALKMEVYRRLVAPYEDGKIYKNGDVFSPSNVNAAHLDAYKELGVQK